MGGDVVGRKAERHGRLDRRVLVGLPDLHAEHDDHGADIRALVVAASAAMVVVRAGGVKHFFGAFAARRRVCAVTG